MDANLAGKKVAFLFTDGVEQVELTKPLEAINLAGAAVDLVSIKPGAIQMADHDEKGDTIVADKAADSVRAADYDALVLPGGVANPDRLRTDPASVRLVREFFDQDKPVAAICHGPWMLVEAGVLDGRTVTSWPSLRTDLSNAGATWVDEPVHVDGRLVTSRKPDDLPAFCARTIETFAGADRSSMA